MDLIQISGLRPAMHVLRDRVYLSDSLKSRLRDDLVNRLDVDSSDKGFKRAELWSDLERLLGEATKLYRQDEDELFSSTFVRDGEIANGLCSQSRIAHPFRHFG